MAQRYRLCKFTILKIFPYCKFHKSVILYSERFLRLQTLNFFFENRDHLFILFRKLFSIKRLDITVRDEKTNSVVQAIKNAASIKLKGDGKVISKIKN